MTEQAQQSAWFQALFVSPPIICGLQLRPYSIGHEMLLAEMGSPFAYHSAQATDEDLLTALQICSRTFRECQDFTAGRFNVWRMARWARRWHRIDLTTAHASFRTYLADYQRVPVREDGDTGGATIKASPYWHFVRILTSVYGYSFDAAWDCPKAVATCCADVWSESQGGKGLVSDVEERIADLVNRGKDYATAGNQPAAEECWRRAQTIASAAARSN